MKSRYIDSLAWLLAGGAGLAALLVMSGFAGWPFSVIENFRPHALAVAGTAGMMLVTMRRWRLAVAVAVFATLNVATTPRPTYAEPSSAIHAPANSLTVVWGNLARSPAAMDALIAYAREKDADLIVGAEYPLDGTELAGVAPDYPHVMPAGEDSPGGGPLPDVFVMSRRPLIADAERRPSQAHDPQIASFSVELSGDLVLNIVAAHPYPPLFPDWVANHEAVVNDVAGRAKPPFLVVGDFNVTPWASSFSRIPGRRVGGLLPAQTWMSRVPLAGLTIDHFLISPELAAGAFEVGPSIGSDHYPILTRIHFAGD